ncbi:hypothetical protein EJB05_30820, partial [Eragrostis curvula]
MEAGGRDESRGRLKLSGSLEGLPKDALLPASGFGERKYVCRTVEGRVESDQTRGIGKKKLKTWINNFSKPQRKRLSNAVVAIDATEEMKMKLGNQLSGLGTGASISSTSDAAVVSVTPPPPLGPVPVPTATTTLARQSGQVVCRRRSQASTHAAWNRCPHRGSARASSPSLSSAMHTAHSAAAFSFSPAAPPARTTKIGGSDATRRSSSRCSSCVLGGDGGPGVEPEDETASSSSSAAEEERLREKSLQK